MALLRYTIKLPPHVYEAELRKEFEKFVHAGPSRWFTDKRFHRERHLQVDGTYRYGSYLEAGLENVWLGFCMGRGYRVECEA